MTSWVTSTDHQYRIQREILQKMFHIYTMFTDTTEKNDNFFLDFVMRKGLFCAF